MPTAGNVPAAKIANCHTHPVALLPKSSLCNRSADAKYENGERDPPLQLLPAGHRGMPLHQQKPSERLWIPLNFDRHWMLVQARSVLPSELANQLG
jgi:hypothetical protein